MTTESASKAFTDEHLTVAFFAKALGQHLGTVVTITDLQLSAGSNVGDNYCSDIHRATVRYHSGGDTDSESTISLIVKAIVFTETRGAVLEELCVFDKEISMYTETLPRMSALLGGERLSAKCIYAVKEPVQIIVFEDLNAAGFKMADRTAGIDVEHCECVLDKLGRFHAASVVLAEQDASAMRHYEFGLFKPDATPSVIFDSLFVDGLQAAIERMREWPGYEGTVKKMEKLEEKFIKKIEHVSNCIVPTYRVLNHGDLWVNNFLFKYDACGRPVDVCFVDYQMSFYSSPGHDLNYFLNTCPEYDVLVNKRDQIVELYHRSFAQTLERLSSKQATSLTMALLRDEIAARAIYGVMASVSILPIVLMTRGGEQTMTLDAMTAESTAQQIKVAMYGNERYVRALRYIVRWFDEQGVLDRAPVVV